MAATRVNPETVFTNRIRTALARYSPQAVVHKYHADEYSDKGIPDLFGDYEGLHLAWEIKVRPNGLDEDQRIMLQRYSSPLAGVMYLDDLSGTADVPEQVFFVRARDLKDKWSYRRDGTHFRVLMEVVLSARGNQTRLPRVDKLCKLLRGLE